MANTVCFHAVGRRKKAIARVRLIPGEGNIIINKRSLDEYFGYETLKDDPLIDPSTIGLKGSPTNIFKSFTPPQKGVGMMLEGCDKATCEKLAGMLAAKHII